MNLFLNIMQNENNVFLNKNVDSTYQLVDNYCNTEIYSKIDKRSKEKVYTLNRDFKIHIHYFSSIKKAKDYINDPYDEK